MKEQDWSDGEITPKGVGQLCQALFKYKHVDDLDFVGLKESPRGVFPSGVAITCALLDCLGIEQMTLSSGALREGVVYDMVGRLSHEDVRERTVSALMQRYGSDEQNANRAEVIVGRLFDFVRDRWGLKDDDLMLLRWAARLHEIGLSIAHNQFHKHGEYLVHNSDLPGFSHRDQQALALLVRGHRRKFPSELFEALPKKPCLLLERLCLLLRLAVLFKCVVQLEGEPEFVVDADGKTVNLRFAMGWLARHPLTAAELKAEAAQLSIASYELKVF